MLVEKKVSVKGEWVKTKEDLEDECLITIKNAGEIVTGTYGDRTVFMVETKNGEKNLSFNQTSMNYLIDGLGKDTSKWVGKDIKVWLLKQNIDGKLKTVVYLTPSNWIQEEEGFVNPDKKDSDDSIPIIDEKADEVKIEDIPF